MSLRMELSAPAAFSERRQRLSALYPGPVLLAAGAPQARNYRANRFPFRATSHFLYLAGQGPAGQFLLGSGGRWTLFAHPFDSDDALWHGPQPSFDSLAERGQFDEVRPLSDLGAAVQAVRDEVATLPPVEAVTSAALTGLLGRTITACGGDHLEGRDAALADAMIAVRLGHDAVAQERMRWAAGIAADAHCRAMRGTKPRMTEGAVLGVMDEAFRAAGCTHAYSPILTRSGEVLHNEAHDGVLEPGDLLLADVGAEAPEGWASDITRVWPISGVFSGTQRAVYDVVLRANEACIAAAVPGTEYRTIHQLAARIMVEGLVELGVFQGQIDGLIELGADAVFFPHGVGHLLGLDVHDMEDLGDRAGYAAGRTRVSRFGEKYLRLDRVLQTGMAVTIEPGFYQVPAILERARRESALSKAIRWDRLQAFSDVRGIRIEDDVLIGASGPQVLTGGVPKRPRDIETMMAS